jgi:hypothetical protein
VLNSHLDPTDIDDGGLLNILPSGQPVKYLGILFGHRLPVDYQIQQLHDKFMASFQQWSGRARTLQGRKLLASTMLLSMLWHVTTVVPVPQSMVEQWQSMVNKFVLGRKTLPTDSYRSLVHSSWQFDKRLGLGVPHIASTIRTQRLLRLQSIMVQYPGGSEPSWSTLVLRQFARTMGKLHRRDHPYDFLYYYPCTPSKWLALHELHPLWRDIWSHWSSTPWLKRIAVPPSLDKLMSMPVWLTTYVPMQLGQLKYTANVASHQGSRRWCMHGAGACTVLATGCDA